MDVRENRTCYYRSGQRDVLSTLLACEELRTTCFLTGGTALSVFYLHHRKSNDLGFFSRGDIPFEAVDSFLRATWKTDVLKLKESRHFLSCLIRDVKVDVVSDPLSFDENRPRWMFEAGYPLSVDTVWNIQTNKFTTVISRTEPKDFIDLYFLTRNAGKVELDALYQGARRKDAIFDDPPTAAYQLEENTKTVMGGSIPFPEMIIPVDREDMNAFFLRLAEWIYSRVQATGT